MAKKKAPITFADKLVRWRAELQTMAELLMDDDEFARAQQVVSAAVIIKDLHEGMAEDAYDENLWSDI